MFLGVSMKYFAGCKESQLYSLPSGLAVTNMIPQFFCTLNSQKTSLAHRAI